MIEPFSRIQRKVQEVESRSRAATERKRYARGTRFRDFLDAGGRLGTYGQATDRLPQPTREEQDFVQGRTIQAAREPARIEPTLTQRQIAASQAGPSQLTQRQRAASMVGTPQEQQFREGLTQALTERIGQGQSGATDEQFIMRSVMLERQRLQRRALELGIEPYTAPHRLQDNIPHTPEQEREVALFGRPLTPQEQAELGYRKGALDDFLRGIEGPIVDVVRFPVPFADTIANEVVRPAARAIFGQDYSIYEPLLERLGIDVDIPDPGVLGQQLQRRLTGALGKEFALPTTADTAGAITAALVPREAWEIALEFVPGIGTVPDLKRALAAGDGQALRALMRAIETPRVQRLVAQEAGNLGYWGPEQVARELARVQEARATGEAIEANLEGARVFTTRRAPDGRFDPGSYYYRPDEDAYVGGGGTMTHADIESLAGVATARQLTDRGWVRMHIEGTDNYGLQGALPEDVQRAARALIRDGADPQGSWYFDLGGGSAVMNLSGEARLVDIARGTAFGGPITAGPLRTIRGRLEDTIGRAREEAGRLGRGGPNLPENIREEFDKVQQLQRQAEQAYGSLPPERPTGRYRGTFAEAFLDPEGAARNQMLDADAEAFNAARAGKAQADELVARANRATDELRQRYYSMLTPAQKRRYGPKIDLYDLRRALDENYARRARAQGESGKLGRGGEEQNPVRPEDIVGRTEDAAIPPEIAEADTEVLRRVLAPRETLGGELDEAARAERQRIERQVLAELERRAESGDVRARNTLDYVRGKPITDEEAGGKLTTGVLASKYQLARNEVDRLTSRLEAMEDNYPILDEAGDFEDDIPDEVVREHMRLTELIEQWEQDIELRASELTRRARNGDQQASRALGEEQERAAQAARPRRQVHLRSEGLTPETAPQIRTSELWSESMDGAPPKTQMIAIRELQRRAKTAPSQDATEATSILRRIMQQSKGSHDRAKELIRRWMGDQYGRLGPRRTTLRDLMGERGAVGRGDEGYREAAAEGFNLAHMDMDEWARFKGFRDFDHAQQVYDEGVASASPRLGGATHEENWTDAREVVEEAARRELEESGISSDYFMDRRFMEGQDDIERTATSLRTTREAGLGADEAADAVQEGAHLSPLNRYTALNAQDSHQLFESWAELEVAGEGMGHEVDAIAQQSIEGALANRAASGADPIAMNALNDIHELSGRPEELPFSPRAIAEAQQRMKALEAEFNRVAQGTLAVGADVTDDRLRQLIPYAQLENPIGNRARFILRQKVAEGREWLKKFIPGELGAAGARRGLPGSVRREIAQRGTGAAVGAAAGATQGDTPQERLKNALLGAGAGAGVADILIRTGLADDVVRELDRAASARARGRVTSAAPEAAGMRPSPGTPPGPPLTAVERPVSSPAPSGERGALGMPEPDQPPASRHDTSVPGSDRPANILRVKTDVIDIDAKRFQGRTNADPGKSYKESRVQQLLREYDENQLEPIIVAPTPGRDGRYTVLSGHHRLEVARRRGDDIDIKIADLDLTDPTDLQQAMLIADRGNTGQAALSLGDRINLIRRLGTEDVAEIRAAHRSFTEQQVRNAIYVQQMPPHVVDKLDKLGDDDPLVGIAAELGRGVREYGFSPSEAEGLFNRLTRGIAKGSLPTPASVRQTVDKFGGIFRERQQLGMFTGDEDFGGSNRVLDAMMEYTRAEKKLTAQKNELVQAIKGARKLDVAADDPAILNATREIQSIEERLASLEEEFLSGLREEIAGPASANASSTVDAGGMARTLDTLPEGTATQPPPEMRSTTSDVEPSGLTTRQTEPSRNLRGETTTENDIGPNIAPAGQMLFAPTEEELAHFGRLIDEGDWTETEGARIGARSVLNMLKRGETPSGPQMDLLNRALTGKLPETPVATPRGPRGPSGPAPRELPPQAAFEDLLRTVGGQKRLTGKERAANRARELERAQSTQASLEGVPPEIKAGEQAAEPELRQAQLNPDTHAAIARHLAYGDWATTAGERFTAQAALTKLLAGGIMPVKEEIDLLERAVPGLGTAIMRKRALGQQAIDEFIGLVGAPQTTSTMWDVSAALRQAAPLGSTHPRKWAEAVASGLRATIDDDTAMEIQQGLRQEWSTGPIDAATGKPVEGLSAQDSGVHFGEFGNTTAERDPQFAALNQSRVSGALGRFPGLRPSEQNYVVTLNHLRVRVYNDIAQRMWNNGVRDPEHYKALGQVINTGSGWGKFNFGEVTKGLNAFFSKRALSARFQTLWEPFTTPGSLLKPGARQQAARNLVGFVGYNTAILGMLAGLGAAAKQTGIGPDIDIEMDPRSSDWGKARFGNTRADFTAGYGSMFRYFARMATGGKIRTPDGRLIKEDPRKLTVDFLRGKFGPVPAAVVDLFTGKDAIGKDVEFTKEGIGKMALKRSTPLGWQDIFEAIREDPVTGIALSPAAFFGASLQTYNQPSREAQERIRAHGGDYKAAWREADRQGNEEVSNSIKAAWRRDLRPRLEGAGLEFIEGQYDPPRSPQIKDPELERVWREEGWTDAVADEAQKYWNEYGIGDRAAEAIRNTNDLPAARTAFVGTMLQPYLDEFPEATKATAEAFLTSYFNKMTSTNQYEAMTKREWVQRWEQHPDLLEEVIDLGLPTHIDAKDEERILGQ